MKNATRKKIFLGRGVWIYANFKGYYAELTKLQTRRLLGRLYRVLGQKWISK